MITLDYQRVMPYLSQEDITRRLGECRKVWEIIVNADVTKSEDLGWLHVDHAATAGLLEAIETKAAEVGAKADVFVLIGVGGSNQGARAVIKAFPQVGVPEVIYAGNNLSPAYLNNVLSSLKGRSVYANVIAKNFATLEPGIHFRAIRQYMEGTYGVEEAGRRIIATGSLNGSLLQQLGEEKGYTLLPFPLDIGGRYSVLSAVGLFPIAVAGVDIRQLLAGAKEMERHLSLQGPFENPAIQYAVIRNMLVEQGFHMEIISFFEPLLSFFSKWWVQLFGESEGKAGKGIFPAACAFSEDLHSLGQYIQEGQRNLFETFLHLKDQGASYKVRPENGDIDGFAYLDNKDFSELNEKAYAATIEAHHNGGVPVLELDVPNLTPYYMGQLFYFFEFACFASGLVLGVNPFDQPGVEAYKVRMFEALGKS